MPPPTPAPLRQRVWQCALAGLSAQAIATSLLLAVRTVYHLLRLFKAAQGPTQPDYRRCGRPTSPRFADLRQRALDLRQQHPRWGAGRIHAQLATLFPRHPLPNFRTLQRWLQAAGLAQRPKRPHAKHAPRATRPHQVWQMDAAEKKRLRSGVEVCWLRLCDEATGAALFTHVFVCGRWAQVPAAAVQAALRRAFARWGRPEALRVDNGTPWVCPRSDLPSDLALWLAGLGVALYRNRVRRPQDNGVVERSQRTAGDWAQPESCDAPEQLQRGLDEEDRVHRQVQLFDGQQTRLQAFPELSFSGKPYVEGAWEDICWDLSAALRCLGECVVQRKVDPSGKVSLYDQWHRVGQKHAGRTLEVRLDCQSVEWVFWGEGQEVKRAQAKGISAAAIRGLCVRRRVGRSARQTQRRRADRNKGSAAGGRSSKVGAGPAEATRG